MVRISFIEVQAVDSRGELHPNAAHQISFRVEGAGSIAAVGSGDKNVAPAAGLGKA